MSSMLVLLDEKRLPKRTYTLNPPEQTIGRGNSNAIPLSTSDGHTVTVEVKGEDKPRDVNNIVTVSKNHGKLLLINGQWSIVDISEQNSISVDSGNSIQKNTPVPLTNGVTISLGHAQLKFLDAVDEAVTREEPPTTITKPGEPVN